MRRRVLLLVTLALPLLASSVEAQRPARGRAGGLRAGEPPAARRQMMEQQLRRGLWRIAKQRIGFTDDQMVKIEQTSERFDQRRRSLAQQEKSHRLQLRNQIVSDSAANQGTIATAMDQLHSLQRQRLDLAAEEQKEFASFMTPIQRAKFMALQDQVRKRMLELQKNRPDSASGVAPDVP